MRRSRSRPTTSTAAASPGDIATESGTKVDADLNVAQQEALLGWLQGVEDGIDDEGDESDAMALRRRLAGMLENLPEAIKAHLERLLEIEQRVMEGGHADEDARKAEVDRAEEHERQQLEDSLRRLAKTLHGALTHRRRQSPRGRIDAGRTMRRNMRFDGIPFTPVTVSRAEDKPRLVILADVSLSVRATARFTLHLVHGLQDMFGQVRSFAFVGELIEVTDLFADHTVEDALGLIFGGDMLDVDANSNYGEAFGTFLEDHASAVNRRSTVIVLGRRARQRERPEHRGVRRDQPACPRDDLADAGTALLVGTGRLRPAAVRGVLRPHPRGA